MTTTPKTKKAPKAETPAAFTAYKGFDKNLQCRGYQYEVGKTYTHSGKVEQCESGFHACQNPFDVLDYYGIGDGNRFAKVTLSGEVDRSDDHKWAAGQITIGVELRLPELIAEAIKWVMYACKGAGTVDTGDYSQLATSGHYSKLATSGYSSKLATSGHYSKLATSGHYSKLATSGDYSQLATSGDYSQLATSGHYSKLATSGHYSKLEVSGAKSAAAAAGPNSSVKAIAGTPIAICEYDASGVPIGFATGIAGDDGIPADTWLKAKGGKLVAS